MQYMLRGSAESKADREHERAAHEVYGVWSREHSQRYENMGTLPYWPWLFRDQRLKNSSKRISRAVLWLPETNFLKTQKALYAKAIGSKAVAASIIDGFNSTPINSTEGAASIADYTIDFLRGGLANSQGEPLRAMGIATGHLQSLTDIGEFTGGLHIAIAEREGKQFADRFSVTINKNAVRESYKMVRLGRLAIPLPITTLAALGFGLRFGAPPGESSERLGMPKEAATIINRAFAVDFKNDRDKQPIVLGQVPSNGGAIWVRGQEGGEVEEIVLRDASFTKSILGRLDGGIVAANRYEQDIRISELIEVEKPQGLSKTNFENRLSDQVMVTLASQTTELTGLPASFTPLSMGSDAELASST